jgi:hypothetical protein
MNVFMLKKNLNFLQGAVYMATNFKSEIIEVAIEQPLKVSILNHF